MAAIALALLPASVFAQGVVCQLGSPGCVAAAEYAQCGNYPLYDDRITGLPATQDQRDAPANVEADTVDSEDGQRYVLGGNVQLQRGDQVLRARQVDYQRSSGDYSASGDVRYQDGSLLLRADNLSGNNVRRSGSARNVEFQMLDSRGNGRAAGVQILPDHHSVLDQVNYTTCSPDRRGWELRAKHIDIDHDAEVGHARNVSMRLGNVPILWLPYVRFPTSDTRHSGMLYPTLGYSEVRGFDITLPWYLNLAPNYDATLYPRLLTQRGAMLGAEFRYLTDRSSGEIRVDYLAHDRKADRSRGLVLARSRTALWPDWSLNVNLNHVSDTRYFEDLGNGLYNSATQLLRSAVYLNGSGEYWRAALGADKYQITDPELPAGYEPYTRLPRALFDAEWPITTSLSAGLDSEFVGFHKDRGLDGRRLDLYPYLDWNLQGPWWHVNPRLAYRQTSYHLDRDEGNTPQRGTPIASVDAGLTFERAAQWFDTGYTQTLEPRLYYLRVPYRNQSDIPIFDTSRQTFDFWQLFSPNQYSGADRQMDANNLTVALTSRLLDAGGAEKMSASIGQIRYFDPQRVQLPGTPETDYSGSAYVAQFSAKLSERWNLNLAQQWNPNGHFTQLSTVAVQHRLYNNGILNLSYRYRRNYLEQLDFSAFYPINERWNAVGRWNYSLDQSRTLEAIAGFEYDSCCVAVRLLGRHYVRNSAGEISNGIMLEIEFKGIGSFGQNAGDLLQHAILGYQSSTFPVHMTGTP